MSLPDEATLRFADEHRTDDPHALALQAARYPQVDMPAAITQIAGRHVARLKAPTWANTPGIVYPARLSMEQCSSEATAQYKRTLVERLGGGRRLADLTGGFGIDCACLAGAFAQAVYVERQETLCEMARHNFPLLGRAHIEVVHADGTDYLERMDEADWIFVDPARRDSHGGKTVAIGQCEPDVSRLESLLLQKAPHVLIKLSPMLDLTLALNDMPHTREVHIVSSGNECKELLLVLGRGEPLPPDEVPVHCVDVESRYDCAPFVFTRRSEREAPCTYAATPLSYLYEPNAALLKAGAFRSVAHIYNMEKLHPSSHLYTSDKLIPGFPGRRFRIEACCGFSKKELKQCLAGTPKANLSIRNFPSSVAELRKRLHLAEGGDTFLFATTLADGKKALIKASLPD